MANFYAILSEGNCQEAGLVLKPEGNINCSSEPIKMKIHRLYSGLSCRNLDTPQQTRTVWFVICQPGIKTGHKHQSILLVMLLQKIPIKHGFLRFLFLFPIKVWKEKGFSHPLVFPMFNGSGIKNGLWLPNNLIPLHRESVIQSKPAFSSSLSHIWRSPACNLSISLLQDERSSFFPSSPCGVIRSLLHRRHCCPQDLARSPTLQCATQDAKMSQAWSDHHGL